MIKEAAKNNARLIMLPEIFNYPYEIELLKKIAEDNNETLIKLQESAKSNKIYLCTGTIAEKAKDKIYNKSYYCLQ